MKKNVLKFGLALTFAVALVACQKPDIINEDSLSKTSHSSARTDASDMVANEVLIKFKNGTSESKKAEILEKIGGKLKENILTKMMERFGDEGIDLIEVNINALEAISKAKNISEIELAEPNYIYTHSDISNDPSFSTLWGMQSTTSSPSNLYGSQAAAAWNAGHTGSSTVFIGIIDEGYMYTHVDLAGNAGKNPGEIAGNNIDDDGNGLKDDVYGWDFAGNDSSVFDGIGDDHGTHVAGTIGAVGGNGIGVAGVNWNVRLLSGKFLGSQGGTTANAIKAVDYFTNLKTRASNPVNIIATNNSWGGGGFSQLLQDAIQRADNAGILFICAAGNSTSNNDVVANYPSNYPNNNIIAVASITSTGAISSFSSYGATKVDIGAPGSAVYSTVPAGNKRTVTSSYASYSGTSMATPHVAGAAALYSSTHPGATASQIKAAIMSTATPTPSLAGKCVTGGRLNVSTF
ncbi:MAG: S8 family peptidase [Bacteroidota bacterium]